MLEKRKIYVITVGHINISRFSDFYIDIYHSTLCLFISSLTGSRFFKSRQICKMVVAIQKA